MRDWNLRVFLHRVGGASFRTPRGRSRGSRPGSRQFWKDCSVDLFAVPLTDYLDELVGHLARSRRGRHLVERSTGRTTQRGPLAVLGLTHFTEENADLFFGRDAERQLIIGNLRRPAHAALRAERRR